ncbi:MAG: hypothetical protein ACR2KW_03940 [Rubrobacter sp.]
MLRTHALPPLSYLVPEDLSGTVKVGSVVVAPLSGRGRLGVVAGFDEESDRAKEPLRTAANFSLTPEVVALCERIARDTSSSFASVLACALPPGISTDHYRILNHRVVSRWDAGARVSRQQLKRAVGQERLKTLEARGYIALDPALPEPPTEEVAVVVSDADQRTATESLNRAPAQRRMIEKLLRDGEFRTSLLLSSGEFKRETLRTLVRRGFVRLEERRPPWNTAPFLVANGVNLAPPDTGAPDLTAGGVFVRRVPTGGINREVVASGLRVLQAGARLLVLAPEVSVVEEVARTLAVSLPQGTRIGVYHAGVGSGRGEVWRAAAEGELDVLVGTRSAALLPVSNLGGVVVVDEPNPSHRAGPGHEGVATHVREISQERSRIEGCGTLFLSPHPSLRLYASVLSGETRELPVRDHEPWPRIRLIDMRGTGAYFSRTLLDACREALERGGRVGVVVDRTGLSTFLVCCKCGGVRSCSSCGTPLPAPPGEDPRPELAKCPRCRTRNAGSRECESCGSSRVTVSGMTVERVAARLSEKLGVEVGTLTAERSEREEAAVIVGTPARVFARSREVIVVPDADALLFGRRLGTSERAFRVLLGAAESAGSLLVVQTCDPEHRTLRAAVRGDYRAFAAEELPRLEALGYPPFGHLARLSVRGSESEARLAVESQEVRAESEGVESSGLVAGANPANREDWLVLLRASERASVASAATSIARAAAKKSARRVRITVEIDPEEM